MTEPEINLANTELPAAIERKANARLKLVNGLSPEPIRYAFLARKSPVDADEYGSLWIFTDTMFGEIENPLGPSEQLGFDIMPMRKRLDYISIDSKNFDFSNADETSVFNVRFTTEDGNASAIQSFGKDCSALYEIYNSHLKNNMIEF